MEDRSQPREGKGVEGGLGGGSGGAPGAAEGAPRATGSIAASGGRFESWADTGRRTSPWASLGDWAP